MNYLAHLYLAGNNQPLLIGGFLGDFIKGPLRGDFPRPIEQGIVLHRRIDSWSDRHPSIAEIRRLLPAQFGRYAAVIADVLADHYLACHWYRFADQPLQLFADTRLQLLNEQRDWFPQPARHVLMRMQADKWLTGYRDRHYSLAALARIGSRLTRPNPLHLLAEPMLENYDELRKLCLELLIDTHSNVAEWRSQNRVNPDWRG